MIGAGLGRIRGFKTVSGLLDKAFDLVTFLVLYAALAGHLFNLASELRF